MSAQLTENSMIECPRHGLRPPAVICRHLEQGRDLGFFQPDADPEDPQPWLQHAWCGDCDAVLEDEGDWTERAEAFAQPYCVCEGCLEDIRKRNLRKQSQ